MSASRGEGEQCTYRACEEGGCSDTLLTLHARGSIKVPRTGSLFTSVAMPMLRHSRESLISAFQIAASANRARCWAIPSLRVCCSTVAGREGRFVSRREDGKQALGRVGSVLAGPFCATSASLVVATTIRVGREQPSAQAP
jgi:hypothetical protein